MTFFPESSATFSPDDLKIERIVRTYRRKRPFKLQGILIHECLMPNHYLRHYDQETLDWAPVITRLAAAEVVAVYYWYGTGCYEGAGVATYVYKDKTTHWDDLGHCSCNDPLDAVSPFGACYKSLKHFMAGTTRDRQKDFETIVSLLKKSKQVRQ